MYTHIIFDLDGTLLNTIDDLADAGNHVCQAHGWPTHTVDEFKRMGAQIQVNDNLAIIEGVERLTGAQLEACDLRAGAALVIAALAAQGRSEISCVQYIERGYEDIVSKFRSLGADIRSIDEPDEQDQMTAAYG